MGKLFYLMGKSASGKNAIYEELMKKPELRLKPLVIYTTRPIRKGETDGEDYHFTDERGLEELKRAGKIIELRSYRTVAGIWNYFTVDDGRMDLGRYNYLTIGTLESFCKIRGYYGEDKVIPLYVETDDGIRLERALKRERKQKKPNYDEMCRRFLADQKDFSEEKIARAGIRRRYRNDRDRMETVDEIARTIRESESSR